MKKIIFAIATSVVLFSCAKDSASSDCGFTKSSVIAPISEQQTLQDSLTAHNIQAIEDSSGFFYSINQPGSGAEVRDLCSTIVTYYTGSFFNGNIFDSTTTGNPAIFQLGQVLAGWQKGIPHVAQGGDITLYIPPSLGYGATPRINSLTGDTIIPANSYLVFHVQVLGIQ